MNRISTKKWILMAVMLVIVIVATGLLQFGILGDTPRVDGAPAGSFVCLGVCAVSVTVCVLGGPFGALVGGLGSLLGVLVASIWVSGAAVYCLPYMILMAGVAFLIEALLRKDGSWVGLLKMSLYTSLILIVAIFLFDLVIMGDYDVAAKALPINLLQYVANAVIAIPVIKIIMSRQAKTEAGARF
ncbi:MAG: hypothetical protein Q4B99_01240 [Clostridia bacterium]|nr:hypothetical protein [Clostridia bacterium]